ncbi:MAG TPA: choice-of-anchor tandem repeat GloVer-containing protein [Chthonomonadales bacterium]|nr:choice-of-anchor tandem repeat GloVer-containing protein [Chthonomonadales bacterium]
MKNRMRFAYNLAIGVYVIVAAVAPALSQQAVLTMFSFPTPPDGSSPSGALALGPDGSFYGTCVKGGAYNAGTVFKIAPGGGFTVLHSFTGPDGAFPRGLTEASDGNLYGVCSAGGAFGGYIGGGHGTAYKITTAGVFTLLHSFTGGPDGGQPLSQLVQASDGNLYGSCSDGGAHGRGTVYAIGPEGTFTVLYSFSGSPDGSLPTGLTAGSDGSLYGACDEGGANSEGTIYRLTTDGTFTLLYTFSGSANGANPDSALTQGSDGSLYGSCSGGGANGAGTLFKISTSGALTLLHSLNGPVDGTGPNGLMQAADGSFYGTCRQGDANGLGTAFTITGAGTFTVLYTFTGPTDGANPDTALTQGPDGRL